MTKQETILHFAAPAPGDVFTEMYAYWLVVVRVGPRSLTAFTFAGTPDNPQCSEWREYADTAIERLRTEYQEHRRLSAPAVPLLPLPAEPARFPMARDETERDAAETGETSAWATVGRVAKALRLDREKETA